MQRWRKKMTTKTVTIIAAKTGGIAYIVWLTYRNIYATSYSLQTRAFSRAAKLLLRQSLHFLRDLNTLCIPMNFSGRSFRTTTHTSMFVSLNHSSCAVVAPRYYNVHWITTYEQQHTLFHCILIYLDAISTELVSYCVQWVSLIL